MPLRFCNNRSDYDIVRVEHDRVFIIDLNLGNKSVTNDADLVYTELQNQWPNRRVIYKDSIGRWDEIVSQFTRGDCVRFKPYNEHIPQL
jgi:hypothetical protein